MSDYDIGFLCELFEESPDLPEWFCILHILIIDAMDLAAFLRNVDSWIVSLREDGWIGRIGTGPQNDFLRTDDSIFCRYHRELNNVRLIIEMSSVWESSGLSVKEEYFHSFLRLWFWYDRAKEPEEDIRDHIDCHCVP